MNSKFLLTIALTFSVNFSTAFAADAPSKDRPATLLMVHTCAGCHGSFGHSLGDAPSIAGLPQQDFIKAMQAYKSGDRPSTIMDRIARGYADEDFSKMAEFFAKQ